MFREDSIFWGNPDRDRICRKSGTPAFAGIGLAGAVYEQGGGGSPNTISGAVSAISALPPPSVTFTSNMINGGFGWSGGDSQTISAFLTNDSPTITNGTGTGSDLLLTSVVNLTGSLTVSLSGSYTFGTTSDDGSVFFLSGNGTPGTGTELAAVDNTHPPVYGQSVVSLTAGHVYNLEYLYYNTACCGDGGGASAVASITGPGTVSFSTLSTPEPGSMVVWGLAGLGMFFVARRRRKA